MNKIKSIKFIEHPVLAGLEFDFSNRNGNIADTVIIAGENGVGKSKLMDAIYSAVSHASPITAHFEMEVRIGTHEKRLSFDPKGRLSHVKVVSGGTEYDLDDWKKVQGIFSDVGINFRSKRAIESVTSLELDSTAASTRSVDDFASGIKQLLVDVQALDDADEALAYRKAKQDGADLNSVVVDSRMSRFMNAFNYMFADLTYSRVVNSGRQKVILFTKNGCEVPIDELSSGEKQIVYRGCFLLRNVKALNGAVVFIDEPEISLHPEWQKRILEFYRRIFTEVNGCQTSQIFVVTHSPFIIHNENRKNDKILVLKRDALGRVMICDRPEYYCCGAIEAIKDAFAVDDFDVSNSCVYLEGRTDEKYLKKALEVFGISAPFQFKWVGHLGANGQEENTGASNLSRAYQFLVGNSGGVKQVCLFDCDTSKSEIERNGVYMRVFPQYSNSKGMKKGIENALVLDDIDVAQFQHVSVKEGDYGINSQIGEFDKMACCDYICSLPESELVAVFSNLKPMIESLCSLFSPEHR